MTETKRVFLAAFALGLALAVVGGLGLQPALDTDAVDTTDGVVKG